MKKTLYPKHILVFLLCWLPAFAFELAMKLFPTLSLSIQPVVCFLLGWGFFLLYLVGWSIAIGISTMHYPRQTIGGILLFFGGNMLLITAEYSGLAHKYLGVASTLVTGAFTTIPLQRIIPFLYAYMIPHELLLLILLTLLFVIVWIVSLGIRKGYRGYDKLI